MLANRLGGATDVEVPNVPSSQNASSEPSQNLNCLRPNVLGVDPAVATGDDVQFPRKRRRIAPEIHSTPEHRPGLPDNMLPEQSVIDAVITRYFATIHHWIPMIHEGRFRARLADVEDSRNLVILLHALVAITLRHTDYSHFGFSLEDVVEQVRISTDMVILHALDSPSVENAQALIMLTWERMGSGNWSKAWALLGSLTRTVDYLQMTFELDESRPEPLLSPLALLEEPRSHAEGEERKRVFWHIFLIDRLCSVTCGWSTGFTSDNVSRQLPCNGGIWRRGEAAHTPYFSMWSQGVAKMGHSVAYLPTYHASPNDRGTQSTSPGGPQGIDISNLGAVAYRIEATESLSRVSSFFLQQHVNFADRKEISNWLTRFKELDLRLVQ